MVSSWQGGGGGGLSASNYQDKDSHLEKVASRGEAREEEESQTEKTGWLELFHCQFTLGTSQAELSGTTDWTD